MEFDWDAYRRLLACADWYFNMSDDYSVYRAGYAEREQIYAQKKIAESIDKERSNGLFEKYCPFWKQRDV